MRVSRALLAVSTVLLVPVMSACGSSGSGSADGTAAGDGPRGGPGLVASWSLTSAAIDSSQLSAFGITITFTDTIASGFGGVNQYTTTFTSGPDGELDFGEIASTMMAGPEDAMKAEQAYLTALDTVTGYTVAGEELELFSGEQEILIYAKG